MTFLRMGAEAPLPSACIYPGAQLPVRGPVRPLEGDYVAALGGSATFGKGVMRPWPQLLEAATGRTVVNFGAIGAGPEAYLREAALMRACAGAAAVVVQVPGAERLCNPFYRVHARRNDRVIEIRAPLRALFPEVDLHDVGFVRALLERLWRQDRARFSHVAGALQAAWVDRMGALLDRLGSAVPVTLLWLGDRSAPARAVGLPRTAVPALVTRGMLDALRPRSAGLVEATVPPPPGLTRTGLASQGAHEAAAAALAPLLAPKVSPQVPRRAAG